MTDDERQRLADGIAAVVRNATGAAAVSIDEDISDRFAYTRVDVSGTPGSFPPLSPHQLVCLHGLVGLPVPTGAVIDALREAGLVEVDSEQLIRADERERCAKVCDGAAYGWAADAERHWQVGQLGASDRCQGRSAAATDLAHTLRRGATP